MTISDRYCVPWRLYVRRYGLIGLWLWFTYITLTQSNALSLLWFFTWNVGQVMNLESGDWFTGLRWAFTSFNAEKAFMQALVIAVGGSCLLWQLAKKNLRLIVTPDRVRVGGLVFGSRYPLAGCTVSMKPHPWAEREQKREERKQREAMAKGHKRVPTMPQYFRRSFIIMLATNGQPRRIGVVYGEENCEMVVTRIQFAIDLITAYDPATSDWEKTKRKLAGLE